MSAAPHLRLVSPSPLSGGGKSREAAKGEGQSGEPGPDLVDALDRAWRGAEAHHDPDQRFGDAALAWIGGNALAFGIGVAVGMLALAIPAIVLAWALT